jgi:16S rRNA processing protein RimM
MEKIIKSMLQKNPDKIVIATVGKTFGFKGFLKLHIHSDFTEQFQKKRVWKSSRGDLEIESFDEKKSHVKFVGFDSLEVAKQLTHTKLFSSIDESRELCELGEDEFFWFDIFGLEIIENSEKIGVVKDIDRIAGTDYLQIETDHKLVESGSPKLFLIPYLDRYILNVDIKSRKIETSGAKDILEAS